MFFDNLKKMIFGRKKGKFYHPFCYFYPKICYFALTIIIYAPQFIKKTKKKILTQLRSRWGIKNPGNIRNFSAHGGGAEPT